MPDVSREITNARTFHSIFTEAVANTNSEYVIPVEELEYCEDIFTDDGAYSERDQLFHYLFYNLNQVVDAVKKDSPAPRYLLTRLAVDAGNSKRKPDIKGNGTNDPACLYAELQLARSLRNLNIKEKKTGSDRTPPAVIYDVHGQPCAYQKDFGEPTAFVWRQAILRTNSGMRMVPASSFVQLHYGSSSTDRRHRYAKDGEPIVSLKNCPLDEVSLLRFSTLSLNRTLAYEAHWSKAQMNWTRSVMTLAERMPQVSRMTPGHVGKQVCEAISHYESERSAA